ncbi:hypothetical protein EDEG_00290, partial [Edhazardia aedis USNM 41457]
MDEIHTLIAKINLEKGKKCRYEKAKEIAKEVIIYLKKNINAENKKELTNFVEKLVAYLENYKDSSVLPDFCLKNISSAIKRSTTTTTKTRNNAIFKPTTQNDEENETIGLETAKKSLEDAIKLTLEHPELFKGFRKTPKCILLYGPPGTGKTHLINSLSKFNINIFKITASDIFSKYQGDSEKQIKSLFDNAYKHKPCIIFIDEIDFLCKKRDSSDNESSNRIKSEMLVRTSELQNTDGMFLLGATNFPWDLDTAFIRRFQIKIYIDLPDLEMRIQLFKFFLSKNNNSFTDDDFYLMAKDTEYFSSSDIKGFTQRMLCETIYELQNGKCFVFKNNKWTLCKNCILGKQCDVNDVNYKLTKFSDISGEIEEPEVTLNHFYIIFKRSKSSITKEDLVKYEDWTRLYGEK